MQELTLMDLAAVIGGGNCGTVRRSVRRSVRRTVAADDPCAATVASVCGGEPEPDAVVDGDGPCGAAAMRAASRPAAGGCG